MRDRHKLRNCFILVAFILTLVTLSTYRVFTRPVDGSPSKLTVEGDLAGNHNVEDKKLSKEMTVVTAYWNLGDIYTADDNVRTVALYRDQLSTFSFILNPVVAYFDDENIAKYFQTLRIGLPTKIVIIDKGDLWAFQRESRMRGVLSASDSTLDSQYVAATHSKYDVMLDAATVNHFSTSYIAWLDVGYFSQVASGTGHGFNLLPPPGFMEDRVSYNAPRSCLPHTAEEIFSSRLQWVSAGLFIGTTKTLVRFCENYHTAVDEYLDSELCGTDEQTLYAMYSDESMIEFEEGVSIQEYRADPRYDQRTSLGLILREVYFRRIKHDHNII